MTSMRETNLVYKDGDHPVHGTWLSVDVLAITAGNDTEKLALITREGEPHRGKTTLPGGLLAAWNGETVQDAAARIVREKVGVEPLTDAVVLDVVSDPHRDERGHTVSIVVALRIPHYTSGTVDRDGVPSSMPFGHSDMVRKGLRIIGSRALVDEDLSHGLIGLTTTVRDVTALLRLCEPITDTAARSRLDRSGMYAVSRYREKVDREGKPGRNVNIYHAI